MDASEVYDAVLDKAAKGGLASLSASEKVIYRLSRFVIDLETGGLTGLLYNMSPTTSDSGWSELHETVAALRAARETAAAAMLGKVAEAVESVPAGAAATWGQFIQSVEGRLARLEPELKEVASSVWDKLEVLAEQFARE